MGKLAGFKASKAKKPGLTGNNSKTKLDKAGLPVPTPVVHKNFFGKLPTIINPTPAQEKEIALCKVEVCLLKGITQPFRIAALCDIDDQTATSYIGVIHARWAMRGSTTRMKQMRGEAVRRTERIMEMLEDMAENGANDVVRTQAMKYLMEANAQRMMLDNITPKTIPDLMDTDDTAEKALTVDDRIKDHDRMTQLAAKLLEHIKQSQGDDILDAEFVEVKREDS